jgi:hypothetical protein
LKNPLDRHVILGPIPPLACEVFAHEYGSPADTPAGRDVDRHD